jgi:dTDP-4-amino-4,6-dideoxygalactose transaminase
MASRTFGLHLMSVAADLVRRDEVAVPSLMFVASANAIRSTWSSKACAALAEPAARL